MIALFGIVFALNIIFAIGAKIDDICISDNNTEENLKTSPVTNNPAEGVANIHDNVLADEDSENPLETPKIDGAVMNIDIGN